LEKRRCVPRGMDAVFVCAMYKQPIHTQQQRTTTNNNTDLKTRTSDVALCTIVFFRTSSTIVEIGLLNKLHASLRENTVHFKSKLVKQ